MIKTVEALRRGWVPPSLHVAEPTSLVDWSAGVRVVTEGVSWPETGRPRRAGVSSFGISGTNAHAILEQAPAAGEPASAPPARAVVTWPLSAATARGLRGQAERLRKFAVDHPPEAVARGLATRAALRHRLCVTGSSAGELADGLDAFLAGCAAPGLVAAVAGPAGAVWVFPGHGRRWDGMCRDLLAAEPAFAAAVSETDAEIRAAAGWSPEAVLRGEATATRPEVAQPLTFTVQVGLARLWESAGLRASAMVGHSQGEIAAAHVAGVLTLADAVRVVVSRAEALAGIAGTGGMVAVAAPVDEITAWLDDFPEVTVAVVNSPRSTVLSVPAKTLEKLLSWCDSRQIRARDIGVDYASHSPMVEPVLGTFRSALAGLRPGRAKIPLFSSVTAAPLDGPDADEDYWCANLRNPVRFRDVTAALASAGHTGFLEVSAHPVLTSAVEETVPDATVLATLHRGASPADWPEALATAWVHGHPVRWARPDEPPDEGLDLPTYAFDQRGYWLTPPTPPAVRAAEPDTDARAVPDSWRHSVVWRRRPLPAPLALTGTWLVVHPAGDESYPAYTRLLSGHGAKPVAVPVDADITAAVEAHVPEGVLSLCAADLTPFPGHPAVPSGLAAAVTLLRAVGRADPAVPVWSVTHGAVETAGHPVTSPAQALFHGLALVGGLEEAGRRLHCVDLPADPPADFRWQDALAAVLAAPGHEDVHAVRPDGWYVRRLVPSAAPRRALTWRPRGTTVITGGPARSAPRSPATWPGGAPRTCCWCPGAGRRPRASTICAGSWRGMAPR
nr:acyltransferase domain-containing protein [Phytohabitans suffuscus]